jgi:hypothetical protein
MLLVDTVLWESLEQVSFIQCVISICATKLILIAEKYLQNVVGGGGLHSHLGIFFFTSQYRYLELTDFTHSLHLSPRHVSVLAFGGELYCRIFVGILSLYKKWYI